MSDKPNITVVYQDARPNVSMTCSEVIVSGIVLLVMAGAVGLWPLWHVLNWFAR